MNDMQLNNPNPPQINLESTTEQIPMKNRRDRSKERQEEFYKQLDQVNKEVIEEPIHKEVVEEPHLDETENSTQQSTQDEDDSTQLDEKTIPRKRLNKEIDSLIKLYFSWQFDLVIQF